VFLPLMVAYNATKKVGADPWVGFSVMAVMMLPAFTALAGPDAELPATVDIFGLPLTIFNYSSQVFPPLLMALLMGPLYTLLRKLIPSNFQVIFVPFLAMLIMIPITAFILAPLGVYVGSGIGDLFVTVNNFSPLIFSVLVGATYPFLVITGTAWSVVPIMFLNISTLGYDFIQGPMGAWNFGCFGVTAGVLLIARRRKNTQMKQVASGAPGRQVAGQPLVGQIVHPPPIAHVAGQREQHRRRRLHRGGHQNCSQECDTVVASPHPDGSAAV
jgi:PTS system beta-glucosides-specific IIC component